jgi:hypothetical protein
LSRHFTQVKDKRRGKKNFVCSSPEPSPPHLLSMADTVQQARAGSRWVTSWIYGMESFPNDKNLLDLIKAVFICAGGDGQVSQTEREFFFGYLDAVGMHSFLPFKPWF